MRIEPQMKYNGLPCSYVSAGCAYEDFYGEEFKEPILDGLKSDGWSTLDNTNKYIRSLLPVIKKVYYKKSERMLLQDFLKSNEARCIVCVYGHFIYVNGQDYWSFFDNSNDKVVCVWYIGKSLRL